MAKIRQNRSAKGFSSGRVDKYRVHLDGVREYVGEEESG